jgi:predicted nuclease with TOPRIM domain
MAPGHHLDRTFGMRRTKLVALSRSIRARLQSDCEVPKMTDTSPALERARNTRQIAARTRLIARQLSQEGERQELLAQVEVLEREASELEAQAYRD